MKYFGCRDDFSIELGSSIDSSGNCQLDFYARGVCLTRPDNPACADIALCGWPKRWFDSDYLSPADIYWEVPFSAPPKVLMDRIGANQALRFKHRGFELGPVTDSFSVLAFARPEDFVLIIFCYDFNGNDGTDLSDWELAAIGEEGDAATTVRWTSLTMGREEFRYICREAYECLAGLVAGEENRGTE
jgi:hypothetical protein